MIGILYLLACTLLVRIVLKAGKEFHTFKQQHPSNDYRNDI